MIFVDDLKWAWDVMFHPDSKTKETMDSIGALIQYYKASFIPLVVIVLIEIVLSAILAAAIASALHAILSLITTYIPLNSTLTNLLGAIIGWIAAILLIVGTIFYVWVAVPFYAFVNALIYHILGKYIFRVFKNEFDNTASAFIYSVAPFAVFGWTIVIPLLGVIVSLILAGWAITILVFSLSNQEGISKKLSSLIIFGIGIIALIVYLLTGI